MQVKPNRTVVRGEVCAIRPAPGGWGAEVDLRVLKNESPSLDDDFLRPEEGSILKLFTSQMTHEMRVGEVVRAEARLNAGPSGGRVRAQAIGRKNNLFVGSDRGGRTAATLYSLVGTCKRHQIDPFAYLHDILSRLPSLPTNRLDELLPDVWFASHRSSRRKIAA